MTSSAAVRRLRAVVLIATALLIAGCSRTDAPPITPAFIVPGTPADVYAAILPEVRERIARETKIVRDDGHDGVITLRFTAHLEDHSVRLVEVRLAPRDGAAPTSVTVESRRFSFLAGRSRDTHDATLEASIGTLIARRTTPPGR